MRELKFRAWDRDAEEMYYSDQEYDDVFFELDGGKLRCFVVDRNGNPGSIDEPPLPTCEPLDNLTEFTGLRDKHGTQMFEGDIVYADANDTTSVIKHGKHRCINSEYDDDFHFGFYSDHGDGGIDETLYPDGTLYEVIGNIYENPNMLSKTTPENSKGGT